MEKTKRGQEMIRSQKELVVAEVPYQKGEEGGCKRKRLGGKEEGYEREKRKTNFTANSISLTY